MVMVANAEKDVVICGDNSRGSDEVPMRILESQGCSSSPLDACVPLVATVAPIPAVAGRHEHDARQVFRVLVSQLHR